MIMIKNDACMSKANIKCTSLTRRSNNNNKKMTGDTYMSHTTHRQK